MQISRRTLMMGGAALLAAPALPRRVLAQATAQLGTMTIEMLSDGNLVLPRDFILGPMPEPEAEAILSARHVPAGPLMPPCNLTLLRHQDRVVLFDIGSGPDFQPTAGLLPQTLDAIGLAPEDILAGMKKKELAAAAAGAAKACGWLPPELRHPAYAIGAATTEAAA